MVLDTEPSLQMECINEEPTPDQLVIYAKKTEEYQILRDKLNEYIISNGGEEIYSGSYLTAYQLLGASPDLDALNAKELEKYAPAPPKLKIPKGFVPKRRIETPEIEEQDDEEDEDFVPLAKRKAALKKTKTKEKERSEKPEKKTISNVLLTYAYYWVFTSIF